MALEWWQWAIAISGALIVGISKTGLSGLGILAVALLALVFPARDSVGTVLILLIAGDIVAIITYRRTASWPHLIRLFPWAAVGVVAGAWALGKVDETTMRRLLAAVLIGLVILQVLRQRQPPSGETRPRTWVAAGTGLAAGFTTMVANAAGPIMNVYLLAMEMPKLLFVGTTAWYFFVMNLFKLPFSYALGMINGQNIPLSLTLVPVVVIGGLIGRWVLHRLDQRMFERIALVLTAVAAIRLLF